MFTQQTPKEKNGIQIRRTLPWALLLATIATFVLSFALSSNQDAPTGLLFLVGLLFFIGFVVTLLFVSPRVRPHAIVTEQTPGAKIVLLRGVHPVFAAALSQMYSAPTAPVGDPTVLPPT